MRREFRDDDGRSFPAGQEGAEEIEILEVVGIDEDGEPIAQAQAGPESSAEAEAEGVAPSDDASDDIEVIFETYATEDERQATDAKASGPTEDELHREQILRLKADFENFKSRIERERYEHHRFATSGLVSRILPVLDNFDRAMAAARPDGSDEALLAGFVLIQRQLVTELEAEGLRGMTSVGEPFDPTRHEAVATDSESTLPAHTVTQVFQRGYFLHDRVLRPALVRVSVNGSDAGGGSDGRKES